VFFAQVLPILLAITASIGTDSLTLFDVKYGISLTASPVSIYVTYSTAREILGIRSSLYFRLGYRKGVKLIGLNNILRKLAIYIPALLIPALWLALVCTLSFSGTAFFDSHLCSGMTLSSWFRYMAQTFFLGSLAVMENYDMAIDLQYRGGLGVVSVIMLWFYGAYTVAHLDEIFEDYRTEIRRESNHAPLLRCGYRVVRLPLSIWHVIVKHHAWFPYAIAAVLYWSWILGMARGLLATPSVSYGQILSVFSTIPPIIAMIELWQDNRERFAGFVRSLPGACWHQVRFFFVPLPLAPTETGSTDSEMTPRRNHNNGQPASANGSDTG